MTTSFTIGQPPIPIRVRRNARARRLTLRLSAATGEAVLTMPSRASATAARDFAMRQEGWLRRQLADQPMQVPVLPGAVLPVAGQPCRIVSGTGRRIVHDAEAGTLAVPGPDHLVPSKVKGWLKAQARTALDEASQTYAARIARSYTRLTLRDPVSRWGSCTSDGGLMYSWRLMLAPDHVLDYVAAHEVAHLVHMNHAPAFWDLVGKLRPDYAGSRDWLRTNGRALHRYRFTADDVV
ncbi:M48 family metallopeptidase [Oceanomicrobium pacificus]|uniref:DUF45 domain-containing protein n=1 Tax=Oceanomicrobium pacificus TaxID=2692916 RepID=A0A6B0TTF7_9RHOB|nr:SprT family zinc-dependent metalloprotease [Oceanomicrobium pacificus]MXU64522.1 DUF45 domain-containing protein [Oceanomicrobium pacificus]